MDKCSEEKFELNNFNKTLNVKESRLCFKIKYYLTPTISTNFKNDKKFKSQKYLCQDCIVEVKTDSFQGYEDTQEHQMYVCTANADIRIGKSLNQTKDLFSFFTRRDKRN